MVRSKFMSFCVITCEMSSAVGAIMDPVAALS